MSEGARQKQWRVTLTVDGKNYGVFDTFSGGNVTANSSRYAAGGMDDPEPQGGTADREAITIGRQFRRNRDVAAQVELDNLVGKGKAVVSRQALDPDKVAIGPPKVFKGVINGCTEPEHDSNGDDPSTFEVEIDVARAAA